jgi:cytochrome c-type protein NapC
VFKKLASSLVGTRPASNDTVWSALPRRSALDTLRSIRRDAVERWLAALLRPSRHDRYAAALKQAALYGGPLPRLAMAMPAAAWGWAQARFASLQRFTPALPWQRLSTVRVTGVGAALLGSIGGAVLLAGGQAGLTYTNSEQFCVSCHEMREIVYAEYKGTAHDSNRSGVRATCSDCHVPREIGPMLARKVGAAIDLYSHFVSGAVDTKEKFEEQRYRMARTVWIQMKENDSRECRHCHDAAAMSSELQSAGTRARHARGKSQGKTCIDCHFGIAHKEPLEGPGPQDLIVKR